MNHNNLDDRLHNKISQMLIVGFNGCSIDESTYIQKAIAQFNIGGVILFEHGGMNKTITKNIKTPNQLKQLTSSLKALNLSTKTLNHLPLLIGVDYEGGQVTRLSHQLGFPEIPSPYRVTLKGEEYAKNISQIMSETLQTYGFNLVFTPSLDLNINPLNPIIGQKERSFSDDPQVVSKIASIYQKSFNRNNILCAFKHFPGHGSSTADSHLGFVDVSQVWQETELVPYQNLISSTTTFQMIMTAHLVNEKLDPTRKPATLSYNILTTLLKSKLKYKGLVVTDDLQMKAISEQYSEIEACVEAINAGADLLMFGNNLGQEPICVQTLINGIANHVKKGIINMSRIDDAFNRIIEVKQQLH